MIDLRYDVTFATNHIIPVKLLVNYMENQRLGRTMSRDRAYSESPSADEATSSCFSKEQVDQLLQLLKNNTILGIPSGSLAHTGSNPIALSSFNICSLDL